jgi:hypothetical protein
MLQAPTMYSVILSVLKNYIHKCCKLLSTMQSMLLVMFCLIDSLLKIKSIVNSRNDKIIPW